MNYNYVMCLYCGHVDRIGGDVPLYLLKCGNCRSATFKAITKEEYEEAQKQER